MQYAEALPPGCPPTDATETNDELAVRFVKSVTPNRDEFDSHAKQNKLKPKQVDPCKWSSCSLYEREKALNLSKLPTFRKYRFWVEILLEKESGKILKGKDGHIDFWMHKNYDPAKHINNHGDIVR
jgi:hypothetical protein